MQYKEYGVVGSSHVVSICPVPQSAPSGMVEVVGEKTHPCCVILPNGTFSIPTAQEIADWEAANT